MQKARFLKKNFFIAILLIVLFAFPAAKAHELKTTSTISALLHINPDDDPIVGQSSEILFLINDKEKKFKPDDCDCRATVIYNDEHLFSSPLFQGKTSYRGIFAPAIPYTFPQKGVYTIILTGEPKNPGSFQAFSISYNVRVERDKRLPAKPMHTKILNGAITILILIGITYTMKKFFITTKDEN